MTNAQIAHHMGLDKTPAPITAYRDMLIRMGLEVYEEEYEPCTGLTFYSAKVETKRGTLDICCCGNGNARILKPNGTKKLYAEKTPAQLASAIQKVLEFANW